MKYANQTIPYVMNANYPRFVNLIKPGDRIFPPSDSFALEDKKRGRLLGQPLSV